MITVIGHGPPALTLVATAFARAGLDWDGALVVSVPDEGLRRAVNVCRAHPKVAVLTGPDAGPAELARALFPQSPRAFVVCEDLGGPGERIVHVRPAEATTRPWRDPSVVLVLASHTGAATDAHPESEDVSWVRGSRSGPAGWALGEEAFEGEVPGAEVRAFALAKLGPRIGDLVWDVDGGGAVAIGCARLGAAAVAVARERAAWERTKADVRAHGVRVAVSRGEPPEVFTHLPDPDAIFLGGTDPDTLQASAIRALRAVVALIRDENEVRPALEILRAEGMKAHTLHLTATPAPGPARSTFVVWGERGPSTSEPPRARRERRPQTITPLPEVPGDPEPPETPRPPRNRGPSDDTRNAAGPEPVRGAEHPEPPRDAVRSDMARGRGSSRAAEDATRPGPARGGERPEAARDAMHPDAVRGRGSSGEVGNAAGPGSVREGEGSEAARDAMHPDAVRGRGSSGEVGNAAGPEPVREGERPGAARDSADPGHGRGRRASGGGGPGGEVS